MSVTTIIIILLILLLIGALPNWPHSRSFGWTPAGVITIVLVIVLILALLGRL